MKLIKKLGLSLVIGGGLLFGLPVNQTTAHASTHLRYYENIPNQTVSVTNSNANVYNNGHLSRRVGTMRSYGTKVEAYYAAHVTKNGKASVYYKFRAGNRTGWVWHGYLKPSKPSNSSENYRQETLALFPGAIPDPALQKVANTASKLITSDSYEYFKYQLPSDEKTNFILLTTTGDGSLDSTFRNGKISYNQYATQNMNKTLSDPTEPFIPHNEHLTVNSFSGWKIAISKGSTRYPYAMFVLLTK
ncbi:hypothetical protein HC026_03115 [Lactobacillus sp. LC28-10]|uniref:D-alanyl-D-alanine carboxypeptidase n=1 Tax=Secundilactobacillus angelensis TaxID=2722706 RepID=A0ABX1KVH8_9LACO|nr:hypothetical protein [Secundilactobacillus angelensis]MCH5461614.1 hypothetical protein [Secundilactobacillus angelensis]NLR17909.1 hypothetical protein [Secundilactobacillus angelensis]